MAKSGDAEPRSPALLHAMRLAADGRAPAALYMLQRHAADRPDNAAAHYDLGVFLLQHGAAAAAVAPLQTALASRPHHAETGFRLGLALEAAGRHVEAIVAFSNAASQRPSLLEARFRAASLFETLGQRDEAIAGFRTLAAAASRSIIGRLAKARLMIAENRDAEAEPVLRQILALQPDNATASDMLGTILSSLGRFAEARAQHERAIAAAPLHAGSFYDICRTRAVTPEDADLLAQMNAAMVRDDLAPEARIKLHLALGKAHDDLGDPQTAMHHFAEASTLRDRFAAFDLATFDARLARLMAQPVGETGSAPAAPPSPIFVVGLPRSGTTLVEQILSAHPDVAGGGELPFWTERGSIFERLDVQARPAFLKSSAAEYASLLRDVAPDAARVTDKMPLNLFWVGLIHEALPDAVFVHCRRSAIDTALSIHRTYFNQHVAMPTGGEALVAFVRGLHRLADHWASVLPAGKFLGLDYELLVTVPAPQIARLLTFCGLRWHEACLHPERNARLVKTPSRWQARQPITASSIGGWRRFAPWLGPLAALGTDHDGIEA